VLLLLLLLMMMMQGDWLQPPAARPSPDEPASVCRATAGCRCRQQRACRPAHPHPTPPHPQAAAAADAVGRLAALVYAGSGGSGAALPIHWCVTMATHDGSRHRHPPTALHCDRNQRCTPSDPSLSLGERAGQAWQRSTLCPASQLISRDMQIPSFHASPPKPRCALSCRCQCLTAPGWRAPAGGAAALLQFLLLLTGAAVAAVPAECCCCCCPCSLLLLQRRARLHARRRLLAGGQQACGTQAGEKQWGKGGRGAHCLCGGADDGPRRPGGRPDQGGVLRGHPGGLGRTRKSNSQLGAHNSLLPLYICTLPLIRTRRKWSVWTARTACILRSPYCALLS
jgi:hypothetical protein